MYDAPWKSAIWRDPATVLGFWVFGKFNNFPGWGQFWKKMDFWKLRWGRPDGADRSVSSRRYLRWSRWAGLNSGKNEICKKSAKTSKSPHSYQQMLGVLYNIYIYREREREIPAYADRSEGGWPIFEVVLDYFWISYTSLIQNGCGEVRPYSDDETDRSARTGDLGRPKDEDFDVFWFPFFRAVPRGVPTVFFTLKNACHP